MSGTKLPGTPGIAWPHDLSDLYEFILTVEIGPHRETRNLAARSHIISSLDNISKHLSIHDL